MCLYHPTRKVDRPYVSHTPARAEYKITEQSKMPKCNFTITRRNGIPLYVTVDRDKAQKQYTFEDTSFTAPMPHSNFAEEYYAEFNDGVERLGVFYNFGNTRGEILCQYFRGNKDAGTYYPQKSMRIVDVTE
jgi:hypothetical protein